MLDKAHTYAHTFPTQKEEERMRRTFLCFHGMQICLGENISDQHPYQFSGFMRHLKSEVVMSEVERGGSGVSFLGLLVYS